MKRVRHALMERNRKRRALCEPAVLSSADLSVSSPHWDFSSNIKFDPTPCPLCVARLSEYYKARWEREDRKPYGGQRR